MMEQFDVKKEIANLKEIYDANKPKKEAVKKAIIGNLPTANNPDVKDFMEHLGIEKPALTPAEGLEKKQKFIKSQSEKRNDAITEAAIRRDAVIFASVEDGPKDKQSLKQKRDYWLIYFRDDYKGDPKL